MKELFRETDVVRNIDEVQFSIFSSSEIQQVSQVEIYKNDFYMEGNSSTPSPNGVLDTRMGASHKTVQCTTCSKPAKDCVGHFGYIDLERPVFHVGFFKNILHLLQNICKRCSHILLKPDDKKKLSNEAKRVSISKSFLQRKDLYKKINEHCKKVTLCPNCGFQNGVVKKVLPLKIVHEQFRNCKPDDVNLAKFKATFNHAIKSNKDLEAMLNGNPVEYIQPRDAFNLFREIPSDHLPLFCMDSEFAHPADLIMWKLPAAPNSIRPSVVSDLKAGTNEDDISQMYVDILFLNNTLKKKISTTTESSMDTWECLQITTALLMNAELNVPKEIGLKRKNTRGFFQRLKGKQGRFRGNLSGKRVDFSSRTVISPDPNLRINEVGVPEEIAKKLTYSERVTLHNIHIMREIIKNGPDVHPGAIYVEQRRFPGIRKSLKYVNRDRMASELRNGDIIERHLMDGDIVLFNRQPSLHKMSIMCHRVKVLPGRTFRFNECVCAPYNADFDGDEMNLHVPQTEEARAEALFLMGVNSNLVTPKNGELIIGATQDFLTGSYLLTQRDQFFSRERAMELISSILCGQEDRFKVQLPLPAIMKPVELWTGKQIFSTILCPYKENNRKKFPFPLCNLITKRKEYKTGEEFSQKEDWIIFRNSELLAGTLDKVLLGSGSKKNLFYTILKDYGKDKSADAMYRVGRLTSQYLINTGFSIGIGDVLPGKVLLDLKKQLLNKGYNKCNEYIEQLATNKLLCKPGCTSEETLEAVILKELSSIRDEAGKACIDELHKSNAALVMALSGSKGSSVNISQMIACVGQQAINGKRVPNGFDNRALPHFEKFSKIPAARGFVRNSFFSGLTPTEFFFHTMGGREGLVDTAVKTSETGYIQRRLVKSLEDLYVAYDMTVRNSSQDVIQFSYGGDGLDPSELEVMDGPLDFEKALNHVRALNHYPKEDLISGTHILELTKQYFDNCKGSFNVLSREYKESILKFLSTYGQVIDMKRNRLPVIKKRAGETNAVDYVERLTPGQLIDFLNCCINRYQSSIMEPGTAVGALCAQSIGEPATQMTLKTFHFAGVAAMNITLGVPRIQEIINASRTISTPIIEAKLKCDTNPEIARQVKGRIEKTLLGEVCECIEESIGPGGYYLVIRLASERIKLLKLEVNVATIKYSIATSKLKIKPEAIYLIEGCESILIIKPSETKDYSMFYHMQYIKRHIQQVVIKGLPTVSRAIINQEDGEKKKKRYSLSIEGNNLQEVIATYGVEGTKCTSNNTCEVFTTLGIEAARSTIIKEITKTMETHGLSIDHRHVMLLADLMTCRGQVHGFTRHGMAKMKDSVLRLASFEKTNDHLFDAAYYGQNNPIRGVSECIIMGKPMSIGTGVLKLLHKHKISNNKKPKVNKLDLVFDHPEFHIPLARNDLI